MVELQQVNKLTSKRLLAVMDFLIGDVGAEVVNAKPPIVREGGPDPRCHEKFV